MPAGLVAERPRDQRYVQAFRFDFVPGGVRLSMMPGPYRGGISAALLLAAAYRVANDNGGRLEVSAIRPWRYLIRTMLGRLTAIRRIVGGAPGVDVYNTGPREQAARGRDTTWQAQRRKATLEAGSET